jgi:Protein of unknown function (DUF2380)
MIPAREPLPLCRSAGTFCVVAIALAAAAGFTTARAQQPAPRIPVAVVEVTLVDASYHADVEQLRALLQTSGKTAEDWLANYLAKGDYDPIDPVRISAALRSMGVSPSSCANLTCAVQLGKTLGANRVVAGKVRKVSNLIWFLEATMVDVRTATVRCHEEFELKGNIVELLPKGTLSLAKRLSNCDSGFAAASTARGSARP